MIRIESHARTDVGLRRSSNEDAFVSVPELGLLALADGMGGAASGEVASGIFAGTVLEMISAGAPSAAEEPEELVRRAFLIAHRRIRERAALEPMHRGMGCTGEMVIFTGGRYVVGHVGDSRVYLFRGGRLRQVTRDHSLLQEQIDSGVITPQQARQSQNKNLVTRALGIDPVVEAEIHDYETLPDDVYLLCSDGLCDMVSDEDIGMTLQTLSANLRLCAQQLVQMANDNGGRDNISVILVRVRKGYSAPRGPLSRLFGWFK